jgi:trehalose/maltose transport system substrate-binding protein
MARRIGIVLLLVVACSRKPPDRDVTVSLSCGSVGKEFDLCKQSAEGWAKKTGHHVRFVSAPSSPSEMLALYQQLLAAGASDIDVFNVDIIWPGILGDFFVDLRPYARGAENQHFASIIRNNTIGGRLVAMPYFTDAGMLYFRKDLLNKYGEPVPTTWRALAAEAARIQAAERSAGHPDLWGFVWQGKAYEGLTCNALEWIAGSGGGTLVDTKGDPTFADPVATRTIEQAASWVGTISPMGVLNYAEEEARGVFQSGNAVFMRNWPYAWSLAQAEGSPVRGKVGVAPLPAGQGERGRPVGTLGGWNLAVSKFSKHPDAAADLVLYMTSPEEQKRHAIDGALHPTLPSVYTDAEVLAANPFFRELASTFATAVPRPSSIAGPRYGQLSSEFANAVHSVLAGTASASGALGDLARRLEGQHEHW